MFSSIEKASQQSGRSCSEIFLDEWGTSGRKRPTVYLLHQYLKKVNLKRAATYVAEKLMKGLNFHVLTTILFFFLFFFDNNITFFSEFSLEPESEETTLLIDPANIQVSLSGSTRGRSKFALIRIQVK